MRSLRATAAAAALALVAGGCSWFHEDYPDTACSSNADCFRAQGEICDLATNTCIIASDAAPVPPTPDARPQPDAPPEVDAGDVDAGQLDAGELDGGM